MSNYTTQTAALKAVTIDTAKIDAKQIDTKKLFINGELFDPSQTGSSQIKESPNQIFMVLVLVANTNGNLFGFMDENYEAIVTGVFQNNTVQVDSLELLSYFYPDRNLSLEMTPQLNLMDANFYVMYTDKERNAKLEKCILDVHFGLIDGITMLTIKLGEEDDNLSELYGGGIDGGESGEFMFYMSVPYATPPSQTSTFSLRQPQVSPLSLEQSQQVFTLLKQQMLDNSAE